LLRSPLRCRRADTNLAVTARGERCGPWLRDTDAA
jgi:hypothetical protein